MSRSGDEYLRHILDEIRFVLERSENLSEDGFVRDEVLRRAFARSLEIIGEAVKQMPEEMRSKYAETDWKSLAGLRDKLIHHYFGVDYALVWDVVKNELPELGRQIEKILGID